MQRGRDSDALYRWRALFKRKGVSIAENLGAAAVTPVEVGFFLDSEDGRQ